MKLPFPGIRSSAAARKEEEEKNLLPELTVLQDQGQETILVLKLHHQIPQVDLQHWVKLLCSLPVQIQVKRSFLVR